MRSRIADLLPGEVFFDRPEWFIRANCKDVPYDIMFPTEEKSILPGLQICRACSVREECLEYALEHRIYDGIWGGTSQRERRKIARRRRLQRRQQVAS